MLDGFKPSVTPPGADDTGTFSGQVLARLAEELVRTGSQSGVEWNRYRLATHFQPIFCVRRGSCLGYEALVRPSDLDGNELRPEQLVLATEPERRILLDWTMRALHLRSFAMVDPGDRTLFLNVHPEAAVSDARGGRAFGDLIRYYGLVPKRVCVEILEAQCADEGLLREAIATYRALGVSIAMDDFGISQSNFDRLVRLRPDVVKIDRSLLANAAIAEARARRMLAALVELLHEANARVAIEGIETAAEARIAIEAKADYLQGFHFCSPHAGLPDEAAGNARLAEVLGDRGGRARLHIA